MRILLLILCLALSPRIVCAGDVVAALAVDGFDFPVGKPDSEGYYRSRGYRPNGHLGEDWNGKGGGNTGHGGEPRKNP